MTELIEKTLLQYKNEEQELENQIEALKKEKQRIEKLKTRSIDKSLWKQTRRIE